MDNIYLLMLVALAALAVVDIVVGVSNDAINFLNSAIGSKAISLRTIMIVASLGIFIGAVFSSGMMEVARKGIFNPGAFYFDEIMVIFMAVIITSHTLKVIENYPYASCLKYMDLVLLSNNSQKKINIYNKNY